MSSLPVIGLTMGDPAGVGPELIVKTLQPRSGVYEFCRPIVIGDAARLRHAASVCGLIADIVTVASPADRSAASSIGCIDLGNVPPDLAFGRLDPIAGQAAYDFVSRAVELATAGEIDAICTLPLNKEALHKAGHLYPGHTELLADLTGSAEVSMMLDTESFRVVHVTTHVGLLDAIDLIDPDLVFRTIVRTDNALRDLGIEPARIGVCAINPHAGENGLFGRGEEETKIAPAVARARLESIEVQGPLPADTLFFRASRGDFDAVIAMYHDQGHGPAKVLGIDKGVNITIGLPIIRTSVDHGTAFDIAGTGKADPRGLLRAIRIAAAMSATKRAM